jgi:hypothetical protein
VAAFAFSPDNLLLVMTLASLQAGYHALASIHKGRRNYFDASDPGDANAAAEATQRLRLGPQRQMNRWVGLETRPFFRQGGNVVWSMYRTCQPGEFP